MRKTRGGFTLLEMMASLAVLGLLGAVVSQIVSGSLKMVGVAGGQMDSFRATRALSDALEGDLRRATARRQPGGYLNLAVLEDDESVRLALSVPDVRVRSVDQYGAVAHVIYRWDKKTKGLQRVEYHAARDTELLDSTSGGLEGDDPGSNEHRRQRLAPSYQGRDPYDWLSDARLADEGKRAAATPLLEAVADLEITCYADRALAQAGERNHWEKPDQLPAAIRVRARLAGTAAQAKIPDFKSLRSIDFYVPLPQADPDETSR